MNDPQALHKRLIRQASTSGWKPNEKPHGWRKAFRAMLDDPRWRDERTEILEFMKEFVARPDAWRIWVDDEDATLYLEFLEVEVSHHISEEKKEHYEWFWWMLDGSDGVRLQIWRMDRFGIISEFMTGDTIHTLMTRLPA